MSTTKYLKGQRSYFNNERCANFMFQLVKAVEHMHKYIYNNNKNKKTQSINIYYLINICILNRYGYFHRDIKPENILVKVRVDEIILVDSITFYFY